MSFLISDSDKFITTIEVVPPAGNDPQALLALAGPARDAERITDSLHLQVTATDPDSETQNSA